jgi:hypothetical protein
MLTKIIGWVLVAFVAYYLLTNPDGAARLIHVLLGWLEQAGKSLSSFLSDL